MAKSYGLIALFETTPEVFHAAEKVRDAGFKKWDVISPFPIHGIVDAMGLPRSKVPVYAFVGGMIGFVTGMLMVWYMNAEDYPLIVHGMPYFTPIFPFPIAYELTILLAAFGTFFGQFITNLLPQHYHPSMNYKKFARLTDDMFAIVIEREDERFDEEKTRTMLEELGAKEVVEVPE